MKSKLEIKENGDKFWRLPNRKFHREDGPAIEWANGDKAWFLNGNYHRTDGPAVDYADGTKGWWLNNEHYTKEEWTVETRKLKLQQILN